MEIVQSLMKKIIYYHFPKCAGTSMMSLLQYNYKRGYYRLPNSGGWQNAGNVLTLSKQKHLDCLTGHMPFGMHKYLKNPEEFHNVTFLRDPIERIVSLYYYFRRKKENKNHPTVMQSSLYQFVSQYMIAEVDNGLTRFLAGREDCGTNPIETLVGYEDYKKAKDNINRFLYIGFVDIFDACLVEMKEILELDTISYKKQLVNPNRPDLSNIDEDTRSIIEKNMLYDCSIYKYAREQFPCKIQMH